MRSDATTMHKARTITPRAATRYVIVSRVSILSSIADSDVVATTVGVVSSERNFKFLLEIKCNSMPEGNQLTNEMQFHTINS